MHIAKTGDVNLIRGGAEVWEEIVRLNCIANEVHEYQNYINALRSHALLVNQYINDKAHIMKLVYTDSIVSVGSVEYLRNKGYTIDTTSNEKYAESLTAALKKRENLMTRINMKRKELERITLQKKSGEAERSLEQLLAMVSVQVGFQLEADITLARFNEYARIIKVRQAAERDGRNK